MITGILSFLKNNIVNFILIIVICLIGFYALQISEMTNTISGLSKANSTLNQSVLNIESDKELIKLSLESERELRLHLQETIESNSKRIESYLVNLEAIQSTEQTKVNKLENTAKELTGENCINSTMPDSIISLFNTTKAN